MLSNDAKIAFLKTVPLLLGVEDAELSSLAAAMEVRSFPAEALIFHENDPGELLYFVLKGSVRIVKNSKTPIILSILQPTEFFGEMALFDRAGRSASVEAQSGVDLLALNGGDFRLLLGKHPGIGMAIIRTLASRVREMQQELMASRAMAEYFLGKDAAKKESQRPE